VTAPFTGPEAFEAWWRAHKWSNTVDPVKEVACRAWAAGAKYEADLRAIGEAKLAPVFNQRDFYVESWHCTGTGDQDEVIDVKMKQVVHAGSYECSGLCQPVELFLNNIPYSKSLAQLRPASDKFYRVTIEECPPTTPPPRRGVRPSLE
jgi:hypothetical protein